MSSLLDDMSGIVAAFMAKRPTCWYATSPEVPIGKVLIMDARTEPVASPKCYLFHPDDWPAIHIRTAGFITWQHLRDWTPGTGNTEGG